MFYKKFLLLCFLIFINTTAQADSLNVNNVSRFDIAEVKHCQSKFSDNVTYSTCLDSVLTTKKRELETWQTDMETKLKKVTSRTDALSLFAASSQEFEQFKNKNCKWQYLTFLPDVESAVNMSKECQVYMTIQRINELKQLSKYDFY
ncbi:hypothetical protein GCM10008107_27420 [Psychrosphaera saromensis]|nr:hypothetical protein GCM10008107_27420 [Psychrosphaera saromensis]GLQ14455.1 hypothetical protein GCM10007917_19100 [Psychrosphaera saromensis]